jgi:hypothetical protein
LKWEKLMCAETFWRVRRGKLPWISWTIQPG